MRTANRWRLAAAGLAALAGISAGCAGMSHTAQGAGIGGLFGAGAGAAVAAATGNDPLAGAAIGGAAGGIGGGIIGNDIDQEERRTLEGRVISAEAREAAAASQLAAAQAAPPLGITDVISLTQQGVSDQVIVNQIRSSGATFQLLPADLQWLKQNNVSDAVILEMQNARPRPVAAAPPPAVVYERPAPVHVIHRPRPVYIIEHGPPPPVLGFGFSFHKHRCW